MRVFRIWDDTPIPGLEPNEGAFVYLADHDDAQLYAQALADHTGRNVEVEVCTARGDLAVDSLAEAMLNGGPWMDDHVMLDSVATPRSTQLKSPERPCIQYGGDGPRVVVVDVSGPQRDADVWAEALGPGKSIRLVVPGADGSVTTRIVGDDE